MSIAFAPEVGEPEKRRQRPAKLVSGVKIIRRACEEPLRQIVGNAGHEGSIMIEKILASDNVNFGFNAATGSYEDLVASGVIDPAKVTRSAL